jgi:hypothetical protein
MNETAKRYLAPFKTELLLNLILKIRTKKRRPT